MIGPAATAAPGDGEWRLGLLRPTPGDLQRLLRAQPIDDLYDVEAEPFASGQFACVRRCRARSSGRLFAAKFATRSRLGDDCSAELRHEVALLALCAPSPRIVALNAVFETPKEVVMVLEYAPGGDLQAVLDDNAVPFEEDAARFVRQLLEALQFLHERRVAHLDIKPQNLVLTDEFPRGDVKLCDFEVSRVINEDDELREILGTPDYVAPEILHYEPITLAADMWSLGVTAYALLTGFSPFGGETDQETFCNIARAQLDFPPELFDGVSNDATAFLRALLVRKPRRTRRRAAGASCGASCPSRGRRWWSAGARGAACAATPCSRRARCRCRGPARSCTVSAACRSRRTWAGPACCRCRCRRWGRARGRVRCWRWPSRAPPPQPPPPRRSPTSPAPAPPRPSAPPPPWTPPPRRRPPSASTAGPRPRPRPRARRPRRHGSAPCPSRASRSRPQTAPTLRPQRSLPAPTTLLTPSTNNSQTTAPQPLRPHQPPPMPLPTPKSPRAPNRRPQPQTRRAPTKAATSSTRTKARSRTSAWRSSSPPSTATSSCRRRRRTRRAPHARAAPTPCGRSSSRWTAPREAPRRRPARKPTAQPRPPWLPVSLLQITMSASMLLSQWRSTAPRRRPRRPRAVATALRPGGRPTRRRPGATRAARTQHRAARRRGPPRDSRTRPRRRRAARAARDDPSPVRRRVRP